MLVVVLLGTGALPAAGGAATAATPTHIILHPANVQSTNWAGYAVTGSAHSVTRVEGSWVQPKIQGACLLGADQYSSFWVGIDGYSSSTVEQVGTDSDCQHGVPTYYAWYEFYPSPGFLISAVAIHPGDTIFAQVKYMAPTAANGHKDFTVSLKDVTTGHSFSKTGKVSNPQRNSAEWIAEAPSSYTGILPLADFGTVQFGRDYTNVSSTNHATISGATGDISSFAHIDAITMISVAGTQTKASPTGVSSDGTSFQVKWVSSGP
jgi:hypothetical protein